MKAIRLFMMLVLFSCVFGTIDALAGNVYGTSAVIYDYANNRTRGYHRTQVDYDTAEYYTPYVCGELYKDGVSQVRACQSGTITAAIYTQYTGTSSAGSVLSDHYVDMKYFEDEQSSYVDYLGYRFSSGSSFPTDWFFYPADIFGYFNPVSIHLGSTYFQSCGADRDTIIAEYTQYNVGLTPTCADFTQTAHSANFTFAELNGGDHAWAIIRGSLLNGLECVRSGNGNVALNINSGYRCPVRNAAVGGASQSRHMFGDAADIASNAGTWQALHDAGKNCGACVEPQSVSGSGHVHVDWRGGCPQGW